MGKYRKKEKLFLAEGLRCVEQILHNGAVAVQELIVLEHFNDPLPAHQLPVYAVHGHDFSEISDTDSPQGVLAVCREPHEASIEEMADKKGLIVLFDEIQDPGNLGTMIRTAAWFSAAALIFGAGTVQQFHPKVVRSTAGATGVLPFLSGDSKTFLNDLEARNWKICLLDGSEKSADIRNYKTSGKTVLVIGNEARGVNSALFSPNRANLRIPGRADYVESLNAAVALSIGLFHLSAITEIG